MNDRDPSVAILMSTYNGERFIGEQLKTIAAQNYHNISLIIRDDGSKDGTLTIVNQWEDKINIRQIDADHNLGPARSFMELADQCGDYDYYAFCDQDDVWDTDKIRIAVSRLSECSSIPSLYFCKARSIDEFGSVISIDKDISEDELTVESELVCGFCPGCAMFFNQRLMEVVREQYYRSLPMHDMVFIMNALALGKVYYDNTPHFSRRMHSGNVVGKEGKNKIQRIQQSIKRWIKDSKSNPYDVFVEDFIENTKSMNPQYDMDEMKALAGYKKSLDSKMRIVKSKRFICSSTSALRSFRIRVLLNLL